jgi:hypothetical protein
MSVLPYVISIEDRLDVVYFVATSIKMSSYFIYLGCHTEKMIILLGH